ncbi:MAG: Hpt domain-containing protein [Rhodospirillaceae bacterium]|nr:Hpt domain-containing protein [Rhodospirillaceae bacterium]
MKAKSQALAGRRVLVVDGDAGRAAAVAGMLTGLEATAATASALHAALDLLEGADPPFDAAILGDRIEDGAGPVLARAIRTSPLLFDLRLVMLAAGPPVEGIDVLCPWPSTAEALVAALVGPVSIAAPETVPEAPVLDLDELESIVGGMTAELIRMLRRFAGQAQKLAADAMAAAAATDAAAAQGQAHALKGAAFSAGAVRLGRAAQAFEKAAAASDWTAASAIDLPAEARALAQEIAALPEPAE